MGECESPLCKIDGGPINWNVLKVFLEVSARGDLQSAARALSLSHSTVFRQLRDLEEEIGTRLFERDRGRYELTEAGSALLERARTIAESFDEIARDVAGRDQSLSGVVRITAPSSFACHFLPEYLHSFCQAHPEVQPELYATSDTANLSSREADIAVRVAAAPREHLVGRFVRAIRWGVYGASTPPLPERPTRVEELGNFPLVGAAGALRSHRAFAWLEDNHLDRIRLRCDDLVAMAHAAARGWGLAVLPDDVIAPGLERLFTFPPPGENSLWVLTHPDLRKAARVSKLLSHIADELASDPRLA